MSRPSLCVVVLCLVTTGPLSGAQNVAASSEVAGTVTYRQRAPLPANALVEVRLEDVSRVDGPAKLIGESVFATAGKQAPLPFRVSYNASDIDPTHRYQVRARIRAEGRLIYASDTAYPVITHAGPTRLVIVVQRVDDPDATPISAVKLQGTHWQLTQLNGNPVTLAESGKEASLVLHPRSDEMVASSGCNSFLGTYTVAQNALRLIPTKNTMISCPPRLLEQEKTFLAAIKAASGYRIHDRILELLEGEKVWATFVAVPQQ